MADLEPTSPVDLSSTTPSRNAATQEASNASLRSSALVARASERAGRYELGPKLAEGGMATVSLARTFGADGFSKTVAVKRLHAQLAADPQFVKAIADEAKLVARIQHPNVVPVLDVVRNETGVFMVMEYVHGPSLAAVVKRCAEQGKKIPASIAMSIVCGVLHGLHASHEACSEDGRPLAIVHRDVSPQNILIGADGVARLVDFGIAKSSANTQVTAEGIVKGKLAYMPREQLEGTVDRRSDVYSAAVVAWELLAGRRLYKGDQTSVVSQVVRGEAPHLNDVAEDVPEDLADVIATGLEGDAANRFATAREMALAIERSTRVATTAAVSEWLRSVAADDLAERTALLSAFEAQPSLPASTETPVAAALPSSRAKRPRVALFAAAAVAAIAAAVFLWPRHPTLAAATKEPPPAAPSGSVFGVPTTVELPRAASAEPVRSLEAAASVPAHPTGATTSRTTKKPEPHRKPSCDPPYTIDRDGIQHFIPGCN